MDSTSNKPANAKPCLSENPEDVCEWNQHGERLYCEACYAEAMPYDHHDENGDGNAEA